MGGKPDKTIHAGTQVKSLAPAAFLSVDYAVRLHKEDAASLGRLRTAAGLEVCEADGMIWMRAKEPAESLARVLRGLPGGEMFSVLRDGQLCALGSSVPKGFLPAGPWSRLSSWLAVELPIASLPGCLPNRVRFCLAPSSNMREPNVLLTSLATWTAYGCVAPEVRLARWHFAVRGAGGAASNRRQNEEAVLVRGRPLPPLPGGRFVEEHGIAVPCGQHWSPAVDAAVLAKHFSLSPNDLLLWRDDERRELIASDQFVRATRAAVRASARKTTDVG